MKKVGICTLYTGYNFGSALQAYALKKILENKGYESELLKLSGSLIKGRDFRLKKMIITSTRMTLYSKNIRGVIKSFSQNDKNSINKKTILEFDEFTLNYLQPKTYSYATLKKKAVTDEYSKFVCGSDQIWNSTAFYVDPFYYLKFAPEKKRIAYAPSFGREYVPKYNAKKISKNISKFNSISIREDSGQRIIKELINKDVNVCLDPSLLLTENEWEFQFKFDEINERYILCYFLNEPSDKARKKISDLSIKYDLNVYFINRSSEEHSVYGGPITFLKYLKNAEYVITDSFHGTAFSINFHKKFFVFDRKYITENQSTRIKSLLNMVNMNILFDSIEEVENSIFDYDKIDKILEKERKKSLEYLDKSLNN